MWQLLWRRGSNAKGAHLMEKGKLWARCTRSTIFFVESETLGWFLSLCSFTVRCLSFQVTDTSSKQSVNIFWQLVILKINALSEGKDFVTYLMTFSIRVYLLVYFTWGARKISTENKYVPLLFRLSVPQGLLLSFLQTTIGLKSIYWVSLKGGTFGNIFFLKKPKISA